MRIPNWLDTYTHKKVRTYDMLSDIRTRSHTCFIASEVHTSNVKSLLLKAYK